MLKALPAAVFFVLAGPLLSPSAANAEPKRAPAANMIESIAVHRSANNPLITFASSPTLGENINGPSVIRVPDWIENPLGRYYMYFAHHHGTFIRLAYADHPEGPWTVYEPGTLPLSAARSFRGHIASPDVHVDPDKQEIRMYFHGPIDAGGKIQKTGVAISKDGLAFEPSDEILGPYYFRVFPWRGSYYAIAKNDDTGWGSLLRSKDGRTRFDARGDFVAGIRHGAVLLRDDQLLIFYSRKGDIPERIVAATVTLDDDWNDWQESDPIEVMAPEKPYEGSDYPDRASRYGAGTHVRQLRDPCILTDAGRTWLYYAVGGEMGIAVAEIDITLKDASK